VSCGCNEFEEIHGFQSPGEYERFTEWVEAHRIAGEIEEIAVTRRYGRSELFEEHWFRCRGCDQVWRSVAPDPPFLGVFERVDSGAMA
jgi:hypothetical protein